MSDVKQFLDKDGLNALWNKTCSTFIPNRPSTKFYPFIGTASRGTSYKITLPYNGVKVSYKVYMMNTMEIVLGSSYQNGATGKIFLSYYFTRDTNDIWTANDLRAFAIGCNVAPTITYQISNPAIFWITLNSTAYNVISIKNLTAEDSATSYDYRKTTIEVATDIPTTNVSSVPITILSNDGNKLKYNGNEIAVVNHAHDYLPLTGGTLTDALTVNSTITASGVIKGAYFIPTYKAHIVTDEIDTKFRTTLLGTNNSQAFITSARTGSSTEPHGSLMSDYASMIAFGAGDTHGFLQVKYSNATARIGGGNADSIKWTADLVHSENIASQHVASADYATRAGLAVIADEAQKTTGTLTITQPNAIAVQFNGSSDKIINITPGSLGLGRVMEYIGQSENALSDGSTTNPILIDSKSITAVSGNVVIDKDGGREYIWNGANWELLGIDAAYKVQQTPVSDPSASGSATQFIDTISQDANGKITVTKKNIPTIPTIPPSLPANGGNADTVDNKHASDFVLKAGDTMTGALTTNNFLKVAAPASDGTPSRNAAIIRSEAVSSDANKTLVHIGSNYGYISVNENNTAKPSVHVDAIGIYRGVIGVGGTFTYDTLKSNQSNNISLEAIGNVKALSFIENGQPLSNKYQPKGNYLTSQDHYKTSVTSNNGTTQSPVHGDSFTIPNISVNANGHVTNLGTTTVTLPSIPNVGEANVQSDWNETDTSSDAYIKNKPTFATVATSGSYNDLTNKPTIPTIPSSLPSNGIINAYTTNGITSPAISVSGAIRFDTMVCTQYLGNTNKFTGCNNAILSVSRFENNQYTTQLGFSGNGIYVRIFNGKTPDTSTSWKTMIMDDGAGNVTASGNVTANAYYISSDERLKTFGDDIKIDFDELAKLRKSHFVFNDNPTKQEIGVSAQEVQKIYPEIVNETEEGTLSVDYSKLAVVALAAIDKLNQRVQELENKLSKYE